MTSSGWPVTRTRPATMLWSRLVARLLHFFASAFPAVAILWMLGVHDVGVVRACLTLAVLAGVLTVLVFTALGVYGREHSSAELRFRRLWFSWSVAFGLVLVLHSLYGFIAYLPLRMMLSWYVGTLVVLGLEQIGMLLFSRVCMRNGYCFGRAVILGATDNGALLARHGRL